MADHEALMRLLADFAGHLVSPYDVCDALHDLADDVVDVLDVAGAGVSLVRGDDLIFATAYPEKYSALERAQEDNQAGPCVDAHRGGHPVLVTDLREDPQRWPALTSAARRAGVVAAAGIPMHLNGARLGALNLYDTRRREWSDEEIRVATVLADVASAFIANAARLDEAQQTAEQLQEALDGRVVIEQAKGILVGERNVSIDEAFEVLRAHSRSNRVPLRSVADAVVNLGLRPLSEPTGRESCG